MINNTLHNISNSSSNRGSNTAWVAACCVGFIYSFDTIISKMRIAADQSSATQKIFVRQNPLDKHLVQQKTHTLEIFYTVCLLLSLCFSNTSHASIIGANVSNTANINFSLSGPSTTVINFSTNSNTVNETIVALPTDATIRFYEFSSNVIGSRPSARASNAAGRSVARPAANLSLSSVPTFVGLDAVTNSGFSYPQLSLLNQLDPINFPDSIADPQTSSVEISESDGIRSGDPIFIVLDDQDRNINDLSTLSIIQDTVTVVISNESGDSITLTLSEIADSSAAPGEEYNTGHFVGFIPTWDVNTLGPIPTEFNHYLPLSPGESIDVNYIDVLNLSGSGQSRVDSLVLNDTVRVFNSISGELLENASVSLLHGPVSSPSPVLCSEVFGATGQPFNIFDPILCPTAGSVFPPLVTNSDGEISLPYTDFTNSAGYLLQVTQSSVRPGASVIEDNLELIAEGFTVNNILSFEGLFFDRTFLPLSFDIPKDSVESDIIVEKSSHTNQTGIGEYVQYTVSVSNQDLIFPVLELRVEDQLPKGFRFVKGSARIDGSAVADPSISSDGQTLAFVMDQLSSGESINIQYITEVTSGAEIGLAINTAHAYDRFGNESNTAQAQVAVIDDLLRTKNFIVGRVFHSTCKQKVDYSIQMRQKNIDGKILYQTYVEGGEANISDTKVIFTLPEGISYDASHSPTENISRPSHVSNNSKMITFELGNKAGYWDTLLNFYADVEPGDLRELKVKAELIFDDEGDTQSTATDLSLNRVPGTSKVISYQFKARFKSLDARFAELNEQELELVSEFLANKNIKSIEIRGHADSQKISSISQLLFDSNTSLSESRAEAVAHYILEKFPELEDKFVIIGKGDSQPIDSNSTEQGRENNRRVELHVNAWEEMDSSQLELPLTYSEAQRIKFEKLIAENSDIALGVNQVGLSGIRVLLEDGSYVVTDKEGKFHFSGLEPGSHVIQVDTETLPADTELFYCKGNTRFAGVPYSQFVDPQAGSLWRADFYVRKKAIRAINTRAKLSQLTEILTKKDTTKVQLSIEGNQEQSQNRKATFILPEHYQYQLGSAAINNISIKDPIIQDNILNFNDIQSNKPIIDLTIELVEKDISTTALENKFTQQSNKQDGEQTISGTVEAAYSFTYNNNRERLTGLQTELFSSIRSVNDNTDGNENSNVSSNVNNSKKIQYLNSFTQKKSNLPKEPLQTPLTLKDIENGWLDQANNTIESVLPVSNFVPSSRSADFAIKHSPDQKATLEINGEEVDGAYYDGSIINKSKTAKITRWRGVFLQSGDNLFKYRVYDAQEKLVKTIDKNVPYIEKIEKVELIEKYSYLVADGITRPRLAIKMSNYKGQSVRQGLQGRFTVNAPYEAYQESEELHVNPLGGYRSEASYTIADEGIAIIELQPTTQSGSLNLDLQVTGKSQRIETWLSSEPRDWILVGVAEGTAAHNKIRNAATSIPEDEADGYYDEGRLAFYSKGRISGDWLLTLAYDSERDDELAYLQQFVDPSMYFTLYGDATKRGFDAQSSEELFVRIERKQFYALFGDFGTGLSQTELGRYNRALTGIKSEFKGEYISYNAFATEETSNHVKDEIQGDGTSGLYRLTQSNILINSETITIETRDRFQSQDIKESKTLRRFLDYEIDYIEGTLIFKEPIFSRNDELDPNIIVIDYETITPVDGDISAGGRVSVTSAGKNIELGMTAISDNSNNIDSELIALDGRVALSEQIELTVESANSQSVTATDNDIKGKAFVAELVQRNDNIQSAIYLRENENNFGIGQQNNSEGGTVKIGGEVHAAITEKTQLNAEVYQQENMDNGNVREVVETKAIYKETKYSLEAGLRNASDEINSETNESQLLLLGASTRVINNKVGLRVNTETGIEETQNIDNPNRYIVGADYQVNSKANLYSEHEVTDGEEKDTQTTRVGVRSALWKNARMNTSVEDNFTENSERTFANFGLVQSLPLNERWTVDLGFDASETINDSNASFDENTIPVSGSIASNDFTAISLGNNYRAENWAIAKRLESRKSDTNDRLGLLIGWQRQLIDGIVYSATMQAFNTNTHDGAKEFNGNASASIAYRPISSVWIVLDRLEYRLDDQESPASDTAFATNIRTSKWINNMKANYLSNRRNQISLNHGIKYVKDNIDGITLSGITQFFGFEYRYDIHERWDVGIQNSYLISHASDNYLYSYGVNAGWNAVKNLWLSVGYNIEGFTDGDFDAADYTVEGPWLKLRFKYDQNSFRDLRRKN